MSKNITGNQPGNKWRSHMCLLLMIFANLTGLAFGQSTPAAKAQVNQSNHHWTSFANGGAWQTGLSINANSAPSVLWTQNVQEGRSQVVTDEQRVYVFGGGVVDRKAKPRLLASSLFGIDKADGRVIWELSLPSTMLEGQETFSGAKPCPRATPLLHNGRLFAVTFTGQLLCISTRDGQLYWQTDLVADLGAIPVQFGFTSSVVADPRHPDRICVLAAGEKAGFFCVSVADGKVLWKADCKTASYATPVLANFGQTPQWVVVTEDEVVGLSAVDGTQLWAHPMLEAGLTNVPTPLIADNNRMIVSGQGWKGTASIKITKSNGNWSTKQLWATSKLQYFYTNWVKLSENIGLGCNDKYLAAFDLATGNILGRWRGFSDANIVACEDGRYLLLGGSGKLSVLKFDATNQQPTMSLLNEFQLTERRCWTPLSVSADNLFARFDDKLVCFNFRPTNSTTLPPLEAAARKLPMSQPQVASTPPKEDPVELIFTTFESKGAQAAFQLYSKLRAAQKLTAEDRIALIEAARQANQVDMAELILQQSLADFPDSDRIRSMKQ